MKTREEKVSSILLMVFVPVAIFYLCYLGIGSVWQKVPSLLLFFYDCCYCFVPCRTRDDSLAE